MGIEASMKVNAFIIGFGIGGLISTCVCEYIFKKYNSDSHVIKVQQKIIETLHSELERTSEKMEDDLK